MSSKPRTSRSIEHVQKVRQLADWGANVIKIGAPEAVDGSKGMGGERDGSDFQKYASEQAQNVI
jgi:hypothetical protein